MSEPAPFVARPTFLQNGVATLLAIGGVALGLWMAGLTGGQAPGARSVLLGWMMIIGYGAVVLLGIDRLVDRSDQIIVDERGIYWRQWSDETIPWNAITVIKARSMFARNCLCIDLADPARYRSTRLMGRVARLNRTVGVSELALSAVGTDKSFAQLRDAVAIYSRR